MTDPIIEAAARALSQTAEEIDDTALWENRIFVAEAVLRAVTPLILERAAKMAETVDIEDASIIAAHIRALKLERADADPT